MRRLGPVLLLLSTSLFAGPTSWTSNGPSGGTIWDIEYNPSNPLIVYAATQGALLRSTDGGASWSAIAGTPSGTVVTAIEIHPANASILYIATDVKGVWKTLDAGATWTRISNGLSTVSAYPGEYYPIYSLAANPSNGSILYAGGEQRIYKTIDGGATWSLTGSVPTYTPIYTLAVDPNATNTVYAGMQGHKSSSAADGVFKSVDGGTTWAATAKPPWKWSTGPHVIWDLEIDRSTVPSTVYLAYEAGGLAKSTDGGASWFDANGYDGTTKVIRAGYSVEVSPLAPSTVFVGGANATYRSTDGGTTWVAQTSGLAGVFFGALAVDPSNVQKMATGNNSELLRTADGGTSWSGVGGIQSAVIDAIAYNSVTGALLGIGSDAVFRSANNGGSWSLVSRFGGLRAPSLASRNGAFYAVTWEGGCRFSVEKGAKFAKSTDNGATWSFQLLGSAARGKSIAVHPANGNIIYVTLDNLLAGEPPMMKSVDGGATWSTPAANFRTSPTGPIAFHPTDTSIVYIGGNDGVYKSIDGGATWTRKANNIFSFILAIAVDPANANRLLAGTNNDLFQTTDAGESWTLIPDVQAGSEYIGSQYGELWPTSIVFDPVSAGTLLVSTRRYGVFRSTDSGGTWAPYNTGLTDPRVTKLIPGTSGFLHASTEGSGIFDLGGSAPLPAPVVTATFNGASVSVNWTYSGTPTQFQVERSFANSGYATIATVGAMTYSDGAVSLSNTYLYRVRPVGSTSVSNVDHATTLTFTDDPVSAGSTIVKAVHLAELRNAAHAMRAAVGLPAATFSDASPAGLPIKSIHMTELRSALGAALTSLGRTPVFTDSAATGTTVRALHFQELRTAVK